MQPLCGFLLAGFAMALPIAGAPAQEAGVQTLRLSGVTPGGVRSNATENWGAYTFELTNFSDKDRIARLLVLYEPLEHVQYGRDVWVPAHSFLSSWMLVGPTNQQEFEGAREIQNLLYDRTDKQEILIRPPGKQGERVVQSRGVVYHKREPSTSILLDDEGPEPLSFGKLPQPDSQNVESMTFVRAFRLIMQLSDLVHRVNAGPMPPMTEAFSGIDHFVIASKRIAKDPAGMQALRHWLQQGGKVWVMLDLIDPELIAPLLGDALDFQLVDRVGLTSFRIDTHPAGERMAEPPLQEHERPVAFARIQLPANEPVRNTVNGWPIWFTRHVGRGEVVFTTLGFRGWVRPRRPGDAPVLLQATANFPMPMTPLDQVGLVLQPQREASPFGVESFQPMLTEEIGYSVVGRSTVILAFGAFLVAGLALGIALRRSSRPELLGWLGPVAALGAAGVFLLIGESSRRSAPPTIAAAQVVDAVSGQGEAAVRGLMAVYRPDSGPTEAATDRGGFFDLDMAGIEGQTRRFVVTDRDAWHWENLNLPAGVRTAPFHDTVRLDQPIRASARFGPEGLLGKVTGPFSDLTDAIVNTPTGRNLAVHLGPDGTFRAGITDILPKGDFLSGAVLTDQQQQRQKIYRALLDRPRTVNITEPRNLLLAWGKPFDLPFVLAPQGERERASQRRVGSALFRIPLTLEKPSPGESVTIPAPLISYQRIVDAGSIRPLMEANDSIDMHLRFQLPTEVLPFQVERARLRLKIDAPSRRVTISGREDSRLVELYHADSPLDPLRIEITEKPFLRLDAEGGLHLNLTISDPLPGAGMRQNDPSRAAIMQLTEKWIIDYLELEVGGRAAPVE
jgi:hypothetical protein